MTDYNILLEKGWEKVHTERLLERRKKPHQSDTQPPLLLNDEAKIW